MSAHKNDTLSLSAGCKIIFLITRALGVLKGMGINGQGCWRGIMATMDPAQQGNELTAGPLTSPGSSTSFSPSFSTGFSTCLK